MASSRIFVKSLPPTFTDDEFRKHFSQDGKREITDAKFFPKRRIGYVGFRTPEEAQKAVKYFNKSFIRMSRIGVELATPIDETIIYKGRTKAPTSKKESGKGDAELRRNDLKRKREIAEQDVNDPKLKEFLEVMRPRSNKNAWENGDVLGHTTVQSVTDATPHTDLADRESDDEYQQVPKKSKSTNTANTPVAEDERVEVQVQEKAAVEKIHESAPNDTGGDIVSKNGLTSDADWARSKTSRLLDLLDDDEEQESYPLSGRQNLPDHAQNGDDDREFSGEDNLDATISERPLSTTDAVPNSEVIDADITTVRTTMRLFVRNLPYDIKDEDLEAEFGAYGNLEEVHVPLDTKTGSAKGFAFVQYSDPDSAEQAFVERDGQIFQGRLIHVIPSKAPRTSRLDDFELAKLPLKKQQLIKKKRESDSKSFNWNSLYMNADAVVASVADRLGLSKSAVLDPTSSDAAVRQAHAETHVIQETKAYFKQQGVDLDSFKRRQRGDTAILVKNIPYDVSRDEIMRLFEEHGKIKRLALPPSGGIAIVEYPNAAQCSGAWRALAYKRVKNTVLLLEKAPKDVFSSAGTSHEPDTAAQTGVSKVATDDLKGTQQEVSETAGTATLFVRNLNFTTTSELLTNTFKPFDGFLSARVKTKTDPKKPGQILSMGFGFLEFQTSKQAQVALKAMDGHVLEGHTLQIRASHKGTDAAEERRKADAEKRAAARSTKIIIKNLPFEATKKDVRNLFGAYGQLRSVRVPQKMDRSTRGFAFADFLTPKEAMSAMDSLRDTHLLGRKLVLDFAAEDPEDAEAEIEKMQQKVGAQVNKVALQKLTSGGRKKFSTQSEELEN